MPQAREDIIDLKATHRDGDIACDVTIATAEARAGLGDALRRGIIRPVRELDNGVEVTFVPEAWAAVRRYIELEGRCCPFLDLSAERTEDSVMLRVIGRPEARATIIAIFGDD